MTWSIYCKSSESMEEIPSQSVHLVVTSPPYNVGIKYDVHDDSMNLDDYLSMLKRVFAECKRILIPGGRVAINIANKGRKPYVSNHYHIVGLMLELGYLMRGECIWARKTKCGRTEWGSWASPRCPYQLENFEYILIFSKDHHDRRDKPPMKTMKNEEFLEYISGVWFITPQTERKRHPAPFPIEIPRRLIKLYSYPGDTVVDPFMGAGTTGVAARMLGRNFIGYDISPKYCEIAQESIQSILLEEV